MTNLPSSADAIESGSYETLEERLFNSERDKDREYRVTVRMERWYRLGVEQVSNRTGASKADVYHACYKQGMATVRDKIGWKRLDDLFNLREQMIHVVNTQNTDSDKTRILYRELEGPILEVDTRPDGSEIKPCHVPVPDSMVSEAKDNYIDRMHMDKIDVHRSMTTIGFLSSDSCVGNFEENAEKVKESFVNSYVESREKVQSAAIMFLDLFRWDWVNGEYDINIGEIEEVSEYMRGDDKEEYERRLDKIKQEIEG